MELNELKSLMESGNGATIVRYLTNALNEERDREIDPKLPADEYKVNALARQETIAALRRILRPFTEYQKPTVHRNAIKDSLYYSHEPTKNRMV